MESIEICYRPLNIFPWKKNIRATVPTQWSEISESQALYLVRLIEKRITKLQILEVFCGLPYKIAKTLPVESCAKLVEAAFRLSALEARYDRFFIPCLEGYLAPEQGMRNMTIGDFSRAQQAWMELMRIRQSTKSEGKGFHPEADPEGKHRIDIIIASLYQDLDNNALEARVDMVKKLVYDVRIAIIFNYVLIVNGLMEKYPRVFTIRDHCTKSSMRSLTWDEFGKNNPGENLIQKLLSEENNLRIQGIDEYLDMEGVERLLANKLELLKVMYLNPNRKNLN
jgi:hypothetical protein